MSSNNLTDDNQLPKTEVEEAAADAATLATVKIEQEEEEEIGQPDDTLELDIVINNVVCSFSVRCHLNLRNIALTGSNVEYRRENGMVTMRLRRPYTTATIWSSGRITCTGSISEEQAKVAARRYARCLGRLGFPVRFQNFRIVNVLGTCCMPWPIKIVNFSMRYRDTACYEPELCPGVTYRMRDPKATVRIFSTGSITVTAATVSAVELSVQRIYPLVYEFRGQRVSPLIKAELDSDAEELLEDDDTENYGTGITPASPASMDSLDPANTITGNARRRAANCWASKLEKKRPRYNDAGSQATVSANRLARYVSCTKINMKVARKPTKKHFKDLNL